MPTVTVSSKGQIVIPLDLRRELGLKEGEQLDVASNADTIVLTRVRSRGARRAWRSWAGALAGSNALEDHRKEHRKEAKR
jgi:AbrB family looped-hinge helix DNA binding protein